MENQEIRIGLIGSQSMHAWAFARACNEPDQNGNYRFPDARVTAVYGVDDTREHLQTTMEKGRIPYAAASMEDLLTRCNAFMILQRRGGEHMAFVETLIPKGCPVFIDKPVCRTREEAEKLNALSSVSKAVICGGSGFKYSAQIRQLKQRIAEGAFGQIREASITYSADLDSPYDGIFFYLPHAVEIMLELFGYDWRSLRAEVFDHDCFTVYVTYPAYEIRLVLNNTKNCRVEICGERCIREEIDAGDIFVGNMENFITAIEKKQVTKDTAALTEHVRVLLAVERAIRLNTEIERTGME